MQTSTGYGLINRIAGSAVCRYNEERNIRNYSSYFKENDFKTNKYE